MDYIIDIQGFRDAHKKFIPKEVAVVSIQNHSIGHWVVKPPHKFTDLPNSVKNTNTYCTLNVHGLEWDDGEISLHKLRYILCNIGKNSVKIYVRGSEKSSFIEETIGRRVINLEEFQFPSFAKLDKDFTGETLCILHSLTKFDNKKEFCALHKAHQIRKWMYANLPDDWKELPVVSPEIVYSSLLRYESTIKRKKVNFNDGIGFDEVDLSDTSAESDDNFSITFTPEDVNENEP